VNILNQLLSGIVFLYNNIFKKKPSWTDIASKIIPQIFEIVDNAITFQGYDTKEKFDQFLDALDFKTGTDPEAIDFLKDVTAVAEEEFFDGIIQSARAYGYAKLKVEGYYQA